MQLQDVKVKHGKTQVHKKAALPAENRWAAVRYSVPAFFIGEIELEALAKPGLAQRYPLCRVGVQLAGGHCGGLVSQGKPVAAFLEYM